MKYIVKAGAPHEYIEWCKEMKGTENEDYRNLQNPEKQILHETLIEEQGWICAYTMRRISVTTSHIEHIKPETLCREEEAGADLDYYNMVACFPREGMGAKYRYGAQQKDDWWKNDDVEFVSPLYPKCEKLFTFNLKGEISAYQNNPQAKTTIGVLRLDHESLTDDRKRVIREFIYGETGNDAMSLKQAESAIQEIVEQRENGQYYEFCVAIKSALLEYIQMTEKIIEKRKFVKKQNEKK